MITIQLNDHTAEDVRCIQELQAMGFPDEMIQRLYDASLEAESKRPKPNVED